MSYFEDGLERGTKGKRSPYGPADILANSEEKREARRGWEAGQSVRAHAEAVAEVLERNRRNSNTSGSDDESSSDHESDSSCSDGISAPESPEMIYFCKIWGYAIAIGCIIGCALGAYQGSLDGGPIVGIIYAIGGTFMGAFVGLVWPLSLIIIVLRIIEHLS